jgi:septal ring factor EnvC (AmiA/AmiB activator)
VANLTRQWFEGNRKWWVAGAIAFSVGLSVGAVTNRNWQRALATGAIALSGAAVATAIIERRRLLGRLRALPPADLNYADLLALEFPAADSLPPTAVPELPASQTAAVALGDGKGAVAPAERDRERPPAPLAPPPSRDRGFGLGFGPKRRRPEATVPPGDRPPDRAAEGALVPSTRAQLSPLPEEVLALERSVERAATRKQHLEAVIMVLRQEEEELKGSLANRKAIHQKLAQDISALEAQRQTLALDREEMAAVVATLQGRREALDRELTAAETLREDLEQLAAQREQRQGAIADLQTQQTVLEGERDRLTEQVAQLHGRRQDLDRAIVAATDTINQLNEQGSRQRQMLQDCQTQIANREAHYRALVTKLNALERQRLSLPPAIAQLKQEHATLTERCQTTRAELDRLRQHLTLRQQTLQDLQTQIGNLETRRALILKIFHNLKQQRPEDLQRILDALGDLDLDNR